MASDPPESGFAQWCIADDEDDLYVVFFDKVPVAATTTIDDALSVVRTIRQAMPKTRIVRYEATFASKHIGGPST